MVCLVDIMHSIVPFNPDIHMEDFWQMNVETIQWHVDEMQDNYQIDLMSIVPQKTVNEFVNANIGKYLELKPPEGIVLILEDEQKVAGMFAVNREGEDIGELHRLWIRPEYRGKGYSTQLVKKIIEYSREFGYSTLRLATPIFAQAAQYVYKKAGFKEMEEYRQATNQIILDYWICMGKKLI